MEEKIVPDKSSDNFSNGWLFLDGSELSEHNDTESYSFKRLFQLIYHPCWLLFFFLLGCGHEV